MKRANNGEFFETFGVDLNSDDNAYFAMM